MPKILSLSLLLTIGCNGAATPTDEVLPPTRPVIAAGGCGLPDYDWLAFDQVGEPVVWEPVSALTMSADTLRLAIGLAGLPDDIVELRYDVQTFRVRYTTQDRGESLEATMLVSMPVAAGEVPTMAWMHPTVGFNDTCAPSAGGLEEGAFNALFASSGMYVVGPDYLGMNGFGEPSDQLHPYVVGEPTAVASLDALRAAWIVQDSIEAFSSRGTRRTVLMGASEGGFAALWADRYQPHYLPEADVVAVVAAVPPADIAGIHRVGLSEPSAATGGLAAAIATWHDWYRMETPLESILEPSVATSIPVAFEETCNPANRFDDFERIDQFFTPAFVASVLDDDPTGFPEHACAMAQNTLLTSDVPYASSAPVLYVVAENDDLVSAGPTRDAFLPLCDAGYAMNYLECAGASHVDGAAWSLRQQLEWVDDRLDGAPLVEPCVLEPASTCNLQDAF